MAEGDLGACKSDRCQIVEVFGPGQRAGDAADVGAAFGSHLRCEVVLGDDIGDPDSSTGLENPEYLGEHGRFVRRQVDDTVGNDHVDHTVGQGTSSIRPLRNSTLVTPAFAALARASVSMSSVMSTP